MSDSKAKDNYKHDKKKWTKGRRKAERPFKGLAVLCVVIFAVCAILAAVLDMFPKTFNMILSGSEYTVENEDESAVYYESSYDSDEERVAAGEELSEEVEAEGATLLKNDNDVLPLDSGIKVTLFGAGSVDLTYGGTGSAGLDTSDVDTLKDALEAVGIEVNETMWEFYTEGAGADTSVETSSGSIADEDTDYIVNEPSLDLYTDTEWDSVAEYGDAAIVVFSRIGGEGADLPTETSNSESAGYLGLSDEERELLQYLKTLKDEGTIDCIIVLLNSSNTIQLDFVDDEDYGVDAVLNIGGVGSEGINAVAKILVGEVNPSGHLADTYLADNLSSPAIVNFGSWEYTNAEEAGLDDTSSYYVVYQEGIYVGYRYYETRYEDYVMGTGNAGDYSYYDDVAYPFGYGLSYTDFEWSDYEVTYDEDEDLYYITITVTNTGSVAGKDVVEIYVQSPYTDYDEETGVEKASVALVGFAKTSELEPGESETVSIEVEGYDLASYDSYGYGTYIMEDGDYYLIAATDAHAAVNNVLAAKGYTPENTDGRMDDDGDASLVWGWTETEFDYTTYSTSYATGVEISNLFDDADLNLSEYVGDQSVVYLSRSDWEGTFPTEAVTLYATDEMIAVLSEETVYDADTYDGIYAGATMPTLEADNGLTLMDLYGYDYDDELWDDLLDQLSFEDMAYLLGSAFHYTSPVESIGLIGTRDENGPTGLTTSLFGDFGDISDIDTMGLPSEDIMAGTWNADLMYEVGLIIGEDCLAADVTFLYGPGANIHRTSYAGRNFEYFSEDGVLSSTLLAQEVIGIESKGVGVMVKHFALNDQETDRIGIGVWINEQALREVYLKAFEYAFTVADGNGVMSSYTRVGLFWNGGNEDMITGILREEWGCTGVVITDNSQISNYYMSGIDMVLAGADIADSMGEIEYDQLLEYEDDPVVVTAMREATHRVAYAVLNSQAVNGLTSESVIVETTSWYYTLVYTIEVIAGIASIALIALCIYKSSGYRNANPKPKKKNYV